MEHFAIFLQGWHKDAIALPTKPGPEGISVDRQYAFRWFSHADSEVFLSALHAVKMHAGAIVSVRGGAAGRPLRESIKYDAADSLMTPFVNNQRDNFLARILHSYVPRKNFQESVCIVVDQQELEYFAKRRQLPLHYAQAGRDARLP